MDKIALNRLSERFGTELKNNYLMSEVTPLKVGGLVDYMLTLHKMDDLIDAITLAQEISLPYIVIGYGSNILFSDYGFPGLVIVNRTSNISFLGEKSQVIVDSGVAAHVLSVQTANRDLGGLEVLATASGSIGSALYSNYKYNGLGVDNELSKITLMNSRGEILTYKGSWLTAKDGAARLRDLKTKQGLGKLTEGSLAVKSSNDQIILTAIFQLRRSRQEDIMRKINDYVPKLKNNNLEKSGDIFFQPSQDTVTSIMTRSGAYKLRLGGVSINPANYNQFVNKKDGQANDARNLIEEVKRLVYEKTNITLVERIEYVGVW